MRTFDIRFSSSNAKDSIKPIMATVIEPDNIGPETGLMMFTHGWGGNRMAEKPRMEFVCETYNLVCVTTEFRQSGYAHDMQRGTGWDCPYDFSFFQVIDIMNAMRQVMALRPGINRQRFFHYGGSQGGHLSLMSACVAPKTFAWVYAACPITFVQSHFLEWAGREFLPHEIAYRDVCNHAHRIQCPIYLEHGTKDVEVPDIHSRRLEEKLKALGKQVEAKYIEGGDHGMGPVTSRTDMFKQRAPGFLGAARNMQESELVTGEKVVLDCGPRKLIIDWSKKCDDAGIFSWQA